VALVRVYCGLASTQAGGDRPDPFQPWLTVAVVDDSGRLLDVCGITDDPAGYVELGAVLAERSGGFTTVSVAADHDEHTVTMLLAAAGRALAVADEDSLDDYADRFGDDESAEELHAPQAERRAVGLARALQAGALAATVQGAPRELLALKPVLAAHGALATGRQAAAAALRDVLRELYPAALRAYPDPTAPIPLAILDALPEPGLLGGGASSRRRDAEVIATIADSGLGDANRVSEAVNALRIAISETPRRTGIGKSLTAAVAQTIQQSVAAVRSFDAAIGAVVGLLTEKATPAPSALPNRLGNEPGATPLRAVREPAEPARPAAGAARRGRAASNAPVSGVPAPVPPARSTALPTRSAAYDTGSFPAQPGRPAAHDTGSFPAQPSRPAAHDTGSFPAQPSRPAAHDTGSFPAQRIEPPAAYGGVPTPRLSPEVPPPGSREDWPLSAAAQSDRSGEFRLVVDPLEVTSLPTGGSAHSGLPRRPAPSEPVDAHLGDPRRAPESRWDTPLGADPRRLDPLPTGPRLPEPDDIDLLGTEPRSSDLRNSGRTGSELRGVGALGSRGRGTEPRHEPGQSNHHGNDPLDDEPLGRDPLGRPASAPPAPTRVTPPWLADDLPAEPAMLRLVEPAPLADPALRDDPLEPAGRSRRSSRESDPLSADRGSERSTRGAPSLRLIGGSAPVEDESDGDLLIFSQIQSAWFTDMDDIEVSGSTWEGNPADAGWQAAERASHPKLGDATTAGLPRRVPQANLVPGSPLPPADERGLRVVRDPAAMAAHTTGYFRGSRRGEEVRGFSIGGRPGRESAGGWDFTRDSYDSDQDGPYEYRSAAHR
jgi:hypothetical protein